MNQVLQGTLRMRLTWIGVATAGVAAVAAVVLVVAHAQNNPAGTDPGSAAANSDPTALPTAPAPVTGAPPTNGPPPPPDAEGSPGPTRTPRTTVRIVFKVIPPNKATVSWGKKRLGLIKPRAPLIVERPRDSGPLDVIVRADGCLPVHTRAYTFTDTTVAVRVTPLDKKNTIYGFREELPPDTGADGGVPTGAGGVSGAVAPASPDSGNLPGSP